MGASNSAPGRAPRKRAGGIMSHIARASAPWTEPSGPPSPVPPSAMDFITTDPVGQPERISTEPKTTIPPPTGLGDQLQPDLYAGGLVNNPLLPRSSRERNDLYRRGSWGGGRFSGGWS